MSTLEPFDPEGEFPNYFKKMLNSVPENQRQDFENKIQKLIEHNISAILKRLQLYYVDENGSLSNTHYFDELLKKMQDTLEKNGGKDAYDLHVYLSGGVVRTLLSYVYKQLHINIQNIFEEQQNLSKTSVDKEKVLKDIEKTPAFLVRENFVKTFTTSPEFWLYKLRFDPTKIQGPYVLGVGSDMDILYKLSTKASLHESKLDKEQSESLHTAIQETADSFLNSAEHFLDLRGLTENLKKSLLPPADVKEYQEQIETVVSQGGSTLDWLAFELNPQTGPQKLVDPPPELMTQAKLQGSIIKKFIHGYYEYIESSGMQSKYAYSDKQPIRGLRPLLEIPFLSIENEALILKELQNLENNKERDPHGNIILSPQALEQVAKLRRNVTFEGAHNRAYRSPEGSALSSFLKITQQLPSTEADRMKVKLPKYQQSSSKTTVTGRYQKEVDEALLNTNEFIANFTDNGTLYHGTPMDAVTAIIRGGFFISNATQGTASYGSGIYTSPKKEIALEYEPTNVLPLHIELEKPIRIINLDTIERTLLQKLQEEADKKGFLDVNELLKNEYKVDIIIHTHVLIQNTSLIKPIKLSDMMDGYGNQFKQKYLTHIQIGNKSFPLLSVDLNELEAPEVQVSKYEVFEQIDEFFKHYNKTAILSEGMINDESSPQAIINQLFETIAATQHAEVPIEISMTSLFAHQYCYLAKPKYVFDNIDNIIQSANERPDLMTEALTKFALHMAATFRKNNKEDHQNLMLFLKKMMLLQDPTLITYTLYGLKAIGPELFSKLIDSGEVTQEQTLSLLAKILNKELFIEYSKCCKTIDPDLNAEVLNDIFLNATKHNAIDIFNKLLNIYQLNGNIDQELLNNALLDATHEGSNKILARLLEYHPYDDQELEQALIKILENIKQSGLNTDNEEMALSILKRYDNINAQVSFDLEPPFSGSILAFACAYKMNKFALALLEKGYNPNGNDGDVMKKSPLIYACENGLKEVVLSMVDKKVELDQVYSEDQGYFQEQTTPLLSALISKHPDIATILIEAGTNTLTVPYLGKSSSNGSNALTIAIRDDNHELIKQIFAEARKQNRLLKMVFNEQETDMQQALYSVNSEAVDLILNNSDLYKNKAQLKTSLWHFYRLYSDNSSKSGINIIIRLLSHISACPSEIYDEAIQNFHTDVLIKIFEIDPTYIPNDLAKQLTLIRKLNYASSKQTVHQYQDMLLGLLEKGYLNLDAIEQHIKDPNQKTKGDPTAVASTFKQLTLQDLQKYPQLLSQLIEHEHFDNYLGSNMQNQLVEKRNPPLVIHHKSEQAEQQKSQKPPPPSGHIARAQVEAARAAEARAAQARIEAARAEGARSMDQMKKTPPPAPPPSSHPKTAQDTVQASIPKKKAPPPPPT